jgi:hypothetical protein
VIPLQITAAVSLDLAVQAAVKISFTPADEHPELGERVVPSELRDWLARLRLLEGVPFAYLAPDAELLPPESIRFFYLDRVWTDALAQGALSVGTVASADRAQLESVYGYVRGEVDDQERLVRLPGGEEVPKGPSGTVTGVLLRSRVVSGWPGLHVRAYREELGVGDDARIPESDPRRVRLLRLERLAPAVLLALFDGLPRVVHIEEPRQGVQFGVELEAVEGQPDQYQATLHLRDVTTADELANPAEVVDVPFRAGSPGVLDLAELSRRMLGRPRTHMGVEVDGAEFAMQVLQFPYRQVFGDPNQSTAIADVFRPSLGLADLRVQYQEVLQP